MPLRRVTKAEYLKAPPPQRYVRDSFGEREYWIDLTLPGHISTEDVRHCINGTCKCDERIKRRVKPKRRSKGSARR